MKPSSQTPPPTDAHLRRAAKPVIAYPLDTLPRPDMGAYTQAREYKKGLIIDKRLSRLRPFDATVFYNLACSYALLNMSDEAFKALHKAVKLGYDDHKHLMRDKDLESIRSDKQFSRLLSSLNKEIHS